MIKAENLAYSYADQSMPALKEINLAIEEGEYLAVVGPIGCGKTTLIKHFNALLTPTEGNVWVDGMNTKDASLAGEIRRRVGMVFQNPDNQIVGMTVEEDVAFGPENLRLPPAEIGQRVEAALEAVGMKNYARRRPHTLSGGEKRLLTIADILAMNPKYIVLDEPASSLDPSTRELVLALLRRLNNQGIAMIHITHHLEEITFADRVVVMDCGRIKESAGRARELLHGL
ncbi:MAG: ATP-binding cassette domain-containing protein [Dethiobacter sp.]|jgi:biotin transport system ATP-binding protein/energy-coupling factor transport system ATP-binding protein|nr:ATP-binding cassette domain-containing protein [Dethiobacter sp.]